MSRQHEADEHLLRALTRAYTARAKLFHNGVISSKIDLLLAEIDAIPATSLTWDLPALGITPSAFGAVKESGGLPHQVFANDALLVRRPHLIGYYRNLAAISQKGIGQILFSTDKYERGKVKELSPARARELCRMLNAITSRVIDSIKDYNLSVSRKAIFAEIGAQLQGTWANLVGRGASREVERVFRDHVTRQDLLAEHTRRTYLLKNGWRIVFGSEPDVAFYDQAGVEQIAIEIKGSLDKAGAQTRYGEAKKSFAKQIAENPRCYTVYLASCFTDAVIEQIRADGQVRDWFNVTSILYDDSEREHFLNKLFHIVQTPSR